MFLGCSYPNPFSLKPMGVKKIPLKTKSIYNAGYLREPFGLENPKSSRGWPEPGGKGLGVEEKNLEFDTRNGIQFCLQGEENI
ncbi:hypothetical protein CDAR_593621 [Caerostris darwini]|uniref:Uncharacterized protein n=1 Tax=Caerostris darwini TaxID=1538125 RepID=A0AAV4S3K0_9ARAC|nr:hypothetical protein CDAR_593621 [Caerostris darwini]